MPNAVLGTTLVDKLIPVADKIRGLHTTLGDRQRSLSIVRRRWSGTRVGDGTSTVISTTTFATLPKIERKIRYDLQPGGLEEEGDLTLYEVSLTFTEQELTLQPVAANEEVFFQIDDAMGQGIMTRYYTLASPPEPDRAKTLSWTLHLRRIQVV